MSSTSGGLSTLACVSEDGCIFVRDYDPFASRDFGQQFGYFSARYATGTTSRFVAVACGDIHIAALDDAGVVWTMGVGPATGIPRQQQHAITKFKRVDTEGFPQGRIEVVAAGSQHSAAVCCDGTLYTWGVNTSGELGIALHGGMSFETEPVQVPGLSGVCGVALGWHFSAAWTADTLWTTGSGNFGQLGLGDRRDRSVFSRVLELAGPRDVDCGQSWTLAIDAHGVAWSTGRGSFLLSRNHGMGNSVRFERVVGAPLHCVQGCAGDSLAVLQTRQGSVLEWGFCTHASCNVVSYPTRVVCMEARVVGRWCRRELAPEMVLAFLMGVHPRLGTGAGMAVLDADMLHRIVLAAAIQPRAAQRHVARGAAP